MISLQLQSCQSGWHGTCILTTRRKEQSGSGSPDAVMAKRRVQCHWFAQKDNIAFLKIAPLHLYMPRMFDWQITSFLSFWLVMLKWALIILTYVCNTLCSCDLSSKKDCNSSPFFQHCIPGNLGYQCLLWLHCFQFNQFETFRWRPPVVIINECFRWSWSFSAPFVFDVYQVFWYFGKHYTILIEKKRSPKLFPNVRTVIIICGSSFFYCSF